MIDIHSHILPGIDDGAVDEQMTLNMLRIAQDDGIQTIIGTPHYHHPNYIVTQEEVEQKVNIVNQLALDHGLEIQVLPGREIMIDHNLIQNMKSSRLGSLANSQYLLVELSMIEWKPYYLDVIYELQLMGYILIFAHPERYIYVQENITKLNPLIKEGAIFQLDAGSITGVWGKKVQKVARELLRQGAFHLIASDAHSDRSRRPVLTKGLQEVEKIAPHLAKQMRDYPKLILGKKAIHPNKELLSQRKNFLFFKKY